MEINMSSYYVRRNRDDRESWTGPIRSARQSKREAAAWQSEGWTAVIEESTPEVRAQVRAWDKAKKARHANAWR
jgi:hypothetical protein